MKRFLMICLCSLALDAAPIKLFSFYQAGEYAKACNEGIRHLETHKKDEKYILLYAFSCLQADKIDRLALPIIMLKRSKEARQNAAYFSVILMQKNLLKNALENHQSLYGLNVPTTDHVLSRVFDLYSRLKTVGTTTPLVLKDPEKRGKSYKIYLKKRSSYPLLVIEEYYDTMMRKRHTFR